MKIYFWLKKVKTHLSGTATETIKTLMKIKYRIFNSIYYPAEKIRQIKIKL